MYQRNAVTLCVLLLCISSAYTAEEPNTEECARCTDLYRAWVQNRSSDAFWSQFGSSDEGGDDVCRNGEELYYECFMKCAKDADGNDVPYDHRNVGSLLGYIKNHCLEHECRYADLQICTSGGSVCNDEVQQCSQDLMSGKGCDPSQLCHPAERVAYFFNLKQRLSCQISYPKLKKDGLMLSREEEIGLQHCKDIILAGCLSNWHNRADQLDFDKIIHLEEDFKQTLCSNETRSKTAKCLNDVTSGRVFYVRNYYSSPCNLDLISPTDELIAGLAAITASYNQLCSPDNGCASSVASPDERDGGPSEESSPTPPPAEEADEKAEETGDSDDHTSHDDHPGHGGPVSPPESSSSKGSDSSAAAPALHPLTASILFLGWATTLL